MMKSSQLGLLTAAFLVLTSSGLALAATQEPEPKADQADPKVIWPAGLPTLAGRYVFQQVASPGGLWERDTSKNRQHPYRQVSINEVPAVLREKLTHAEVVITDLQLPSTVDASERTSPSGRGKLRFYEETVQGRLVIHGLPGTSGREHDSGEYKGNVLFRLLHQGHSNPSVSGILTTRIRQESTWGAATLDYADFIAEALAPDPPNGDVPAKKPLKPVPAKPKTTPASAPAASNLAKKDAPTGEKAPDPDAVVEAEAVMANARILRSGVELFIYVEWEEKSKDGTGSRIYNGTVRLVRSELLQPATPPAVPMEPVPANPGAAAK